MGLENEDNVTGFLIQGFSEFAEIQFPIFTLFLIMYLIILLGNVTVFAVISSSSHLHTPMYIFLMNLSCLDISFTTNILPNLLHVLLTQHKDISFVGCMTQMYFFGSFTCSEFLLLTAMAYDRYVAICHPLHYVLRMSLRNCAVFVAATWTIGFLEFTGHTVLISNLSFCASNLIEHFFCDVYPLLKLSCTDTFNVELLNYIEGTLMTFNSFLLTLISYIFIVSTIVNIQSSGGRSKAFSTCTSHLTCVIMFYGTLFSLYMRPSSHYSPSRDKFFALVYVVMNPLLNPFVYTLKNKEFQDGLKKLSPI
ncbi:olfactory receptor 1C1-like [Bombina bombina]|uniref:olfactory receptor 1C1-like n=1 Tax=Bombina bombina TaxID=8345 RepID=UPI00235AD8EC|nr:olfactory receptor 1C1-like [Bombina bombina]